MAKQKILVPYNFTRNDEKSIEFVIQRFGNDPDTEITLFHTYIPVPDVDITDKTIMNRISGNLAYLRQKNVEFEEDIKKAANKLVQAGFVEDRVNYVFKPNTGDTAQEIIDQAAQGKFTGIVLNRNPGRIRKFFTASISKKVAAALKGVNLYTVH